MGASELPLIAQGMFPSTDTSLSSFHRGCAPCLPEKSTKPAPNLPNGSPPTPLDPAQPLQGAGSVTQEHSLSLSQPSPAPRAKDPATNCRARQVTRAQEPPARLQALHGELSLRVGD